MTPSLLAFGIIRPKGADLAARCADLAHAAVLLATEHKPALIAVETPSDKGKAWGGYRGRSVLTIAPYGAAVGAILGGLAGSEWGYGPRAPVVGLAADEWPIGWAPSGGKDKPGRVRLACTMFGVTPEALGAATVRPNTADAALVGFAAANRQAGFTGLVMAFDPSITATGWAILKA